MRLLIIVLLASGCRVKAPTRMGSTAKFRIQSANLHLNLDPSKSGFSGTVDYQIDVLEKGDSISFDSVGLQVASNESKLSTHDENVVLYRPFGVGPTTVSLNFSGEYGDSVGIFKQDFAGKSYLFSDFQPNDARKAFPCVDSPNQKYEWDVSITHPAGAVAYGNELAVKQISKREFVTTIFKKSEPLATYMVAVAVGTFQETIVSPAIRILHPGELDVGSAKSMLPKIIQKAESYFGSRMPFSPIKFVAVPRHDGAMENPGLVTIDATILSSQSLELLRRKVLTHEVIHMWIGNHVTVKSWQDTWWQEGLTTHLTTKLLDDPYYYQEQVLEHLSGKLQSLATDAQPLRPGELSAPQVYFSSTGYFRAANFFAAIESSVGSEKFDASIKKSVEEKLQPDAVLESLARTQAEYESWRLLLKKSSVSHYFNHCTKEPVPAMFCVETDQGATCDVSSLSNCPKWSVPSPTSFVTGRVNLSNYRRALDSDLSDIQKAQMLADLLFGLQSGVIEDEAAESVLELFLTSDSSFVWYLVSLNLNYLAERSVASGREREHLEFLRRFVRSKAHEVGWKGSEDESVWDRRFRRDYLANYVTAARDSHLIFEAFDLVTKSAGAKDPDVIVASRVTQGFAKKIREIYPKKSLFSELVLIQAMTRSTNRIESFVRSQPHKDRLSFLANELMSSLDGRKIAVRVFGKDVRFDRELAIAAQNAISCSKQFAATFGKHQSTLAAGISARCISSDY